MKTIFEEMGGTYTQVGDYLLPNLTLQAEEKNIVLGRFGMAHKAWLKSNKPGLHRKLMISASLSQHCKEVEDRAGNMLETLIKQMANSEGITEELKVTDQMAWVGAMNNIRICATEIVFREVIYVI
jgi:hypothetical protein